MQLSICGDPPRWSSSWKVLPQLGLAGQLVTSTGQILARAWILRPIGSTSTLAPIMLSWQVGKLRPREKIMCLRSQSWLEARLTEEADLGALRGSIGWGIKC